MLSSFSQAVVFELLSKENLGNTVEAVAEWRALYPNDPERAALQYAAQLSTDYEEMYCSCKGFIDGFMKLGLQRVHWRRVAEYLMDRFATPEQQQVVFHAIRIPSLN
jgi:hypothetical protein